MSSLSPERIYETNDAINSNSDNNLIDLSAYRKAMIEVQNSSAHDYQARIKSMEQLSSSSKSCLPELDISFSCVQKLSEAGTAIRDFLGAGIPVCELLAAGFAPADLLAAGVYSNDLLAAGASPLELGIRYAG